MEQKSISITPLLLKSGYSFWATYLGIQCSGTRIRIRSTSAGSTSLRSIRSFSRQSWHTKRKRRYGLALFHEIGITSVDQWFSNYSACDQAYLLHFYRTGEKRDAREFWRDDAPLISAKTIPTFAPKKRVFRMDGFVI